jgi:hypothetical protein
MFRTAKNSYMEATMDYREAALRYRAAVTSDFISGGNTSAVTAKELAIAGCKIFAAYQDADAAKPQSQTEGNKMMLVETLIRTNTEIEAEHNFEGALNFMFKDFEDGDFEDEDNMNIHLLAQLRKLQEFEFANAE